MYKWQLLKVQKIKNIKKIDLKSFWKKTQSSHFNLRLSLENKTYSNFYMNKHFQNKIKTSNIVFWRL